MTETDPIPNSVTVDSERAEGKSKKREGFRKPKSELPPNRNRNWRLRDDPGCHVSVSPHREPRMSSRTVFRMTEPCVIDRMPIRADVQADGHLWL